MHEAGTNRAGHHRCAIYARVSTEKQAHQNISVPDQISRARVFAELEGWEVVEVFSDPGASARDDSKRPEFRRMIAEACEPHRPYDVILVHNYSRFYRDHAWFELVRRKLRKNRVRIRSVTENVSDDGDGFALGVLTLLDRKKSNDTSRDVRRAMQANAREGFRCGGTNPFGYELHEVEKRGMRSKNKLRICEEEAAIIRLVFEQHQQGRGIKAIAQFLNDSGHRTRKNNKWGTSTVERLLKNETYAGRSYFKPKDPDTGETVPRDEWILVPCPAIVAEDTFQRVQEQLKRRAPKVTAPRYTNSRVLLGGVARCGSCGRRLHLCTGKGLRYYKCSGKLKYGACDAGKPMSIREDALDTAVLRSLAERLMTPERFTEVVAEVYARRASTRDRVEDSVRSLRKQLADIGRREKNLWELAASLGLSGVSGFKEKVQDLEEQKSKLLREVAAQEATLASSIRLIDATEAAAVAEKMKKLIYHADVELRRRFVNSFVKEVVVFEDEIHISGKLSTLAEAAMA